MVHFIVAFLSVALLGAQTSTWSYTDPATGQTVYGSVTVQVIGIKSAPANQAPTALFTATPTSGSAPLQVLFDASGSKDLDGSITAYQWTFTDGGSATGVKASHTFVSAGRYVATLTVVDNQGLSATSQATVTVAQPASFGPVLPGGRFTFSYPNLFTGATGAATPEGYALRFAGAKANPAVMEAWIAAGRDIRKLNPKGAHFKHINLRALDNRQRGLTGSKIEGRPDYDWIHANHPEWILKDATGKYVPLYLPSEEVLDFGNEQYLDWVLNTWMPTILDSVEKEPGATIYLQHDNGSFKGMQINCAAADAVCNRYRTDEGVQSAWVTLLTRLKQRWPNVKIIISSFSSPVIPAAEQMSVFQRIFQLADGYYDECLTDRHCWWGKSTSGVTTAGRRVALDTTMKLASWLADQGKIFMPHEGQGDGIALTQADTDYAWAFFNLLRKGELQFFNKLTKDAAGNWVPMNFPEMDIALGAPLEAAIQVSPNVYRRQFENAIAYVNLSDARTTLSLPSGAFVNSLGQTVASPLTLNPFAGLTVYRKR